MSKAVREGLSGFKSGGGKNNNKRTPLPPYRYVGFLQAARWFVVPEGRHGDLKLANAEYDEPRAK